MKKFFLMFVGLLALSLCVACGSKKSSDDDDDDEDDDDKTEIVDKEKTSDKEVNEKKAAANTDADTSATRQDVDSIVCNKVGEMEVMKEAYPEEAMEEAHPIDEAPVDAVASRHSINYDVACQRLLTEDDMRGMSNQELRIMRNWIFARHGYIFTTTDMQQFFAAQPWYSGRYRDVTSFLSDIEIKNIDFIKRHE